MVYKIARFLQLAGLIILPFAISGNLAEKLDLKQFYFVAAAGVVIFFVGWLLQQMVKPE